MLLAALLHFCTKSCCLEIRPAAKELVLAAGSSLSLTCSGSGDTTWEIRSNLADQVESGDTAVRVSSAGSSVLTLQNVNWNHTGTYQCVDQRSGENQEVAVFVPGELSYFISSADSVSQCF